MEIRRISSPLSLPSWERGLKLYIVAQFLRSEESLPSWERGLKHNFNVLMFNDAKVAPLVGAWIETKTLLVFSQRQKRSLPSWERGLKHLLPGLQRLSY